MPVEGHSDFYVGLHGDVQKKSPGEGSDAIKLKKDQTGQHHYIPLSWVTSTADGKIQVDRPGQDAMNDWMTTPTIQ